MTYKLLVNNLPKDIVDYCLMPYLLPTQNEWRARFSRCMMQLQKSKTGCHQMVYWSEKTYDEECQKLENAWYRERFKKICWYSPKYKKQRHADKVKESIEYQKSRERQYVIDSIKFDRLRVDGCYLPYEFNKEHDAFEKRNKGVKWRYDLYLQLKDTKYLR